MEWDGMGWDGILGCGCMCQSTWLVLRSSLFVHGRFASSTTYATGCFHVCARLGTVFGGGGGGDDDAPVHETEVPAE
jgi:hypothetical protein